MDSAAQRLARVEAGIAAAAARAGRKTGEIQLIAVSKTHEADAIRLRVIAPAVLE